MSLSNEIILDSSMVEHSAVNRVVVGSSPTRGVRRIPKFRSPFYDLKGEKR